MDDESGVLMGTLGQLVKNRLTIIDFTNIFTLNEMSTNQKETIMGRNREQNKLVKEARKEQILQGALKVFAKKGLAGTKITDIKEETGMAQGLLYHYFKSKNEIYIELFRTAFERLNSACKSLKNMPLSPKEKITTAITRLLANLDSSPDSSLWHVLVAQGTMSENVPLEVKQIIKNESSKPYDIITAIMHEGQKDGTIKKFNPDEMALAFWTSIKGLAITKANMGSRYKSPDPKILTAMFIN
ncbi:MAG: TetR family transcriptional regulator [Chitinivibrionales bacterium]|nr:TetR family transcriptional regulator [Chitinivibrionales bacterium]